MHESLKLRFTSRGLIAPSHRKTTACSGELNGSHKNNSADKRVLFAASHPYTENQNNFVISSNYLLKIAYFNIFTNSPVNNVFESWLVRVP